MEGGREPTEGEIQRGLRLPNPRKIQGFRDPLKRWQEVRGSGIPSWRKELLPEEEVEGGEDGAPPPQYKEQAEPTRFSP